MKIISEEILKETVDKYGVIPQMDMAIEEMAELTFALQKLKRSWNLDSEAWTKIRANNVREEIADVSLMIQQLRLMFGAEGVDEWAETKLDRLKSRLKSHKNVQ